MAFGVIRELVTRLGFTIDDAEARRYERRLQNLGKKIRGVGRSLSLFVTAPIVALGGSFIKAAADAEETESKFKEVFSSIADEADATAKALAKDFDLANSSAQEMLSTTGDILVGFGFTESAALDLSKQVNSLAVDIASFKNVQGGAAQASNAITKALLGEREMLKGIGIAILEEDVKLKIAQLTAEGMTFATNRQAKSFATLKLVIDRSTKAIGDYNRTQDSATNSTRRLIQKWKELSVQFGTVLLPLFTDLVEVLSSVVEWLNSFTPSGRKAIIIIAGITAALGPLLIVLGSIVAILVAIPVLTIAAVAAVGALAFLITEDIKAFVQGRKSVTGLLLDALKGVAASIFDLMRGLINDVFAWLSQTWVGWIAEHVTPWINQVKALLQLGGTPQPFRPAEPFQFISPLLAPQQRPLPQASLGGGGTSVNAEITVVGTPGMSVSELGTEVANAVRRLAQEAGSRSAATPRLAT